MGNLFRIPLCFVYVSIVEVLQLVQRAKELRFECMIQLQIVLKNAYVEMMLAMSILKALQLLDAPAQSDAAASSKPRSYSTERSYILNETWTCMHCYLAENVVQHVDFNCKTTLHRRLHYTKNMLNFSSAFNRQDSWSGYWKGITAFLKPYPRCS